MIETKTNLIVLTHGTWGKDENGWYQLLDEPHSFYSRLTKSLNDLLDNVMIFPFEWSGENSHEEREKAAAELANKLISYREKYSNLSLHFIAHSHGGNVVLKAVEKYLYKLKKKTIEPFLDKKSFSELSESVAGYFNKKNTPRF